MGNSHFKSNYIGFTGNEYIASVAAIKNVTLFQGTTMNVTTASANVMKASGLSDNSYMQIGAQQYLFVGNSNTEASIIAEALALVATPHKGSLYLGRKGQAYFFTTDAAASPIGMD